MAVQDYKINYKSDFVLNINGDAGWAVPFCIKFWTGMPSQAYFVGFDGVKYVNCRVGDTPTQLLVMFDDHHLPIGKLKMQIAYHTTIEEFPGSVFDEVTNARDVIVTIDGTDYQVMLDFTGEDAPELEFDLPAYANEAERIQNELQRQQNEAARISAELQREQATAAAVQGAENVNAQLNGTTLTVTNRQGVSTSVNTKGEQGEQGPVGPEGPQGEQGVSIVSFRQVYASETATYYSITFSDGHEQSVAIPKGAKGDTGATGPTGPQGPQGDTGVSITGFVETGETETDTIYNITFSNGTTQQVSIPKGEKGDQGPVGPQGPQGPMGDVSVITPEQQAAFTMYSTTGQNTDGPMTQKAVTDADSISYALTHFNNFIPVSCWANKKYDGVGLYTGNGYYSFGLTALEGGTKILVKASLPIERLRSYISDAYITKQQSSGITVDSLPLVISSTLSLITVPSNRTNIGISFYGNPGQVSYCICEDDFNLTDYSDEKIREIESVFDGLLFPLSEKEDIQYTSPSSYMYIDGSTWYWKTGSASTTSVFAKVSPSSRYLIQAPNSNSISFFWLKDTSAANNTFPNFAGGGMPRDFWVGAGNSITIDTPEDCEYLCFLIHTRLNRTKPAYIIKRTNDINVIEGVSSIGEKALSVSNGVSKAVELKTIASYGLYINTQTNKWISNTSNNYSVIYHVIGGSKIKITASQSGQSEYIMLKSLGTSAGDDVEYAKGVSGGIRVSTGSTIDANVPSDAKYVYFLVHSRLSLYAPTYVEGMCVNNGIDAIDFIGDSMTQRNVSATWPRGFYAGKVMQYLGIDGLNMGAGGENAATILGRCNGIPWKLASDVAIPADTTQVQIYLTNIYGQCILPILQRYTSHTIIIDGIEGTLTTTQTNPAAMSANYFFQRKESGSIYNAKAGDDVFVKDFKATLNPNRAKVIWVGENGGFDTDSTYRYGGDITNADDRARLIDMIKAYIAVCGCKYYMVLSASRRTNNELESDFAKAFGNRYFNVRMYMVNHGIDDAIALGYLSASSYPTQQDITDMANGIVPSSLRADETHFTENGYYTMAYALSIKLKEVWNL